MTVAVVDHGAARAAVLSVLKVELTRIGWTDLTKNFWHGCSKVDSECRLCYADTQSKRYGRDIWGTGADRWFMADSNNAKPRRWNQIAEEHGTFLRVFCGSMMDWAEIHRVPEIAARMAAARQVMFETIEATPALRWQMLTKRPENVTQVVPEHWLTGGWPANAWLGTSVGYQRSADKRIPELLAVPGPRIRFLSCEPLIGPVALGVGDPHRGHDSDDVHGFPHPRVCLTCSGPDDTNEVSYFRRSPGGNGINWVIIGGESGPLSGKPSRQARRMNPDWVKALLTETRQAEVPVFVKQTGTVLAKEWGLTHRKGEDPAEWPAWMKVQQFPDEEAA